MTDPNQRVMNWQIKTDTGRMKETLDTLRPNMLKHFEAAVVSLCEMETKARQTLNAAGVHTIFYVAYLNYARQLYNLSRQIRTLASLFALRHFPFPLCAEASRAKALRWGPRSCSTNGQAVAGTHPRRVPRVAPWTCPLLQVLAAIRTQVFDDATPTP